MFIQEIDGIERVLVLYTEKKRLRQLLDFDDLLSAWLRLMMDHADVREMLAGQFQHILVDEYQDTNAIQGAIVDLLASKHRNLTVVGDDSQSIYSFRGANFENIITFKQRYPDAKEYKLETNYRSVPEILTLANASIAQNSRRLPKNLKAIRTSGLKPAIVACQDHFTQSRFIAEYVLHLLDQGRTLERHRRALSQPLALAGDSIGIPASQYPVPHPGRPALLRAGAHEGHPLLPPRPAEPQR